jgi:hypothetical protein
MVCRLPSVAFARVSSEGEHLLDLLDVPSTPLCQAAGALLPMAICHPLFRAEQADGAGNVVEACREEFARPLRKLLITRSPIGKVP